MMYDVRNDGGRMSTTFEIYVQKIVKSGKLIKIEADSLNNAKKKAIEYAELYIGIMSQEASTTSYSVDLQSITPKAKKRGKK